MCEIPVPLDDGEKIVRAVFSNHLKNKTKFNLTLFDAPDDRASCMRHTYLGSDECKRRALKIKPGNPGLKFKGMAVIGAREIRSTGSEVKDSREIECGHAHVSTNINPPPQGDPLHAEEMLARHDRLRALSNLAQFVPDPDASADTWTGAPL